MRAAFDHVLVDEYQDTNRCKPKSSWPWHPDGAGLTVVADDAQSIYGGGAGHRTAADWSDTICDPAPSSNGRSVLTSSDSPACNIEGMAGAG